MSTCKDKDGLRYKIWVCVRIRMGWGIRYEYV